MIEITDIKEIKSIILNLACEIKEICEENNLRYYLSGGTLLGAVRHKGFIPWDDDLDIHMPRPDYEKFIEIYNSKPRNNILYSQETNLKYLYSFAKLVDSRTILYEKGCHCGVEMGLYVDIFPIEGMGNTIEEAQSLMKKIEMPINLYMSYRMDWYRPNVSFKKNILVFCAKVISKLFNPQKLSNKINSIAQTYDFDKCKYVGSFIDEVGDRRINERVYYDKECFLSFEGVDFAVPFEYKKILENFYGDYMTPPPKEQQVLTHGYKAFYKEKK